MFDFDLAPAAIDSDFDSRLENDVIPNRAPSPVRNLLLLRQSLSDDVMTNKRKPRRKSWLSLSLSA